MMYCLRSYIPLLLLPLPLSLSPLHLTLLLLTTYYLNRPCIYCSFLLLILFASSCHWSGRCLIDFSTSATATSDISSPASTDNRYLEWFTPGIFLLQQQQKRGPFSPLTHQNQTGGQDVTNPISHLTTDADAGVSNLMVSAVNSTISALAGAAFEEAKRRLTPFSTTTTTAAGAAAGATAENVGIGLGWLRSLLGRTEWTIPCLEIKVRL